LFFKAFCRRYLTNPEHIFNDYVKDDVFIDVDNTNKDDNKSDNNDNKQSTMDSPVQVNEQKSRLDLFSDLKNKKISNAGCCLCDVEFSDDFPNGMQITNAKLLFGTELV